MTTPGDQPKPKQIYCNRCHGHTNHEWVGSTSRVDEDFYEGQQLYWCQWMYSLWRCLGCETGVMETSYTDAASYNRDKDEQIYEYEYSPVRRTGQLARKRFVKLPRALGSIYEETIEAYNLDLRILCAGGLRSLIQGICREQDVKPGTLEKEIDGLRSMVRDNIVDNLHGFRFLGNRALHELQPPERSDLRTAIEVAEALLNYLYDLDYKARRVYTAATKQPKKSAE